ncbi:hypothetical protein [Sphingomonas sp.]|uniref:hypothetical protein n=1 Tax=Sphingomonas sp. TaxID=28214 RepID=UPI001DB4565A|nr:hypothetical protein [Sphingomonas sp.]MBX9797032.1 hypothetical protein [Sphingomonas sp.]
MPLRLDPSEIANLATPIATAGAIRADVLAADDLFEFLVGIAVVIYETSPL